MPRFPKSFGRRKSSSNALEAVQNDSEGEHSFKVFEREPTHARSFDGGVKLGKPSAIRAQSFTLDDDDNMFEDLKGSR